MKTGKVILFLAYFLICSGAFTYAQDFTKVHQLVTEGLNSIFNMDFPSALSKFQEAKIIAPNDLRGPFFESTVYFWRAMLTKNRTDYEQYLTLSDNIIKKCEDITDKNENDLDAQFYKGWTYTMRAFIVYFIDRKMLQAASDLKDGKTSLLLVTEKNPNYYDAYLGLGEFNYLTSMIPRKLQWLTNILGFSGDKATGKQQLITASEKGTYTNTEAKFYLTLLAWREEDYSEAEKYATDLKTSYPASPAIWMVWGLLLTQQDKMSDAIDAYEKAIELNKEMQSDVVYKTAYGALCTSYFRTNQFEKAADYGKKYMKYATKDDYINSRLYSIGVSLELLGNRNDAMDYYKQAKTDFKEDNEWEKHYLRLLTERVAAPITHMDSLLIVADNNRATGRFDEAHKDIDLIRELAASGSSSDDITAQINNGDGQIYFKQKDYNKAIDSYKLNLNLNPEHEKWLVPEADFQIGRCMLRLGKKSEAQDWFDKALAVDYDYDFKDSMEGKVKNELAKFK